MFLRGIVPMQNSSKAFLCFHKHKKPFSLGTFSWDTLIVTQCRLCKELDAFENIYPLRCGNGFPETAKILMRLPGPGTIFPENVSKNDIIETRIDRFAIEAKRWRWGRPMKNMSPRRIFFKIMFLTLSKKMLVKDLFGDLFKTSYQRGEDSNRACRYQICYSSSNERKVAFRKSLFLLIRLQRHLTLINVDKYV